MGLGGAAGSLLVALVDAYAFIKACAPDLDVLAQAKVTELDVAVGLEENIVRFEVSVDVFEFVDRIDRPCIRNGYT